MELIGCYIYMETLRQLKRSTKDKHRWFELRHIVHLIFNFKNSIKSVTFHKTRHKAHLSEKISRLVLK
mgnify:FL=1